MNLIIQSRTVSLYKCRDKVPQYCKGTNNMNSCYSRLIRFFKMKNVEGFILGIRSLMLSMVTVDLTYLILDRSNWKRGTKNFNVLTLGNLCNGIFLPLHWIQLNKRGNSNLAERKTVMEAFINLLNKFGKTVQGSILLADREFIGQDWFAYLLTEKISFVIRLREKMYFELQTHTGKKKLRSSPCASMPNNGASTLCQCLWANTPILLSSLKTRSKEEMKSHIYISYPICKMQKPLPITI